MVNESCDKSVTVFCWCEINWTCVRINKTYSSQLLCYIHLRLRLRCFLPWKTKLHFTSGRFQSIFVEPCTLTPQIQYKCRSVCFSKGSYNSDVPYRSKFFALCCWLNSQQPKPEAGTFIYMPIVSPCYILRFRSKAAHSKPARWSILFIHGDFFFSAISAREISEQDSARLCLSTYYLWFCTKGTLEAKDHLCEQSSSWVI